MDARSNLRRGRMRLDSEWARGWSLGALMWMQTPPFALDSDRSAIPVDQEQREDTEEPIFVPAFENTATTCRLEPGVKASYRILPFRALVEDWLPVAIQQRWEVSVAASRSAQWHRWFQTLDPTQQKAHVQSLSKRTKDKFWAGLWLEYEEWSQPRHSRSIAAAARAWVILQQEIMKRQARIQQRWEVSVAAAMCAQWRLWFKTLNPKQQKAHVQNLSKTAKDTFWAGFWLEYEEWSQPRCERLIAAAARAWVIIQRENMKKVARAAREAMEACMAHRMAQHRLRTRILVKLGAMERDPDDFCYLAQYGSLTKAYEELPYLAHPTPQQPEPEGIPKSYTDPPSAPPTPRDIALLRLPLTTPHFRLPAHASRFATQIFAGKSYKEAVAEQKSNFSSWTRESRVRRVEGQPDYVVWGNIAVHKDAVPKLTPKKGKQLTGKRRYQNQKGNRVSRSGLEK